MKKMIPVFAAVVMFAACNNQKDLNTKESILTDTSAMYRSNIMTDTGSVIQANRINYGAVANRPANYAASTPYRTTRTHTHRSAGNSNSGYSTSTASTTSVRRRGWSHAAKDATIGGVGGAITGAIISKHHGTGALIGGVLGAAGGYVLGRSKDKREGRY